MELKLLNIFGNNEFRITQTPHTTDRATDCTSTVGDKLVYLPIRGNVSEQQYDQFGNPFFEVRNKDVLIRFVHCKLMNVSGEHCEGELIGTYEVNDDKHSDHVHLAIRVNGSWVNVLNYMKRSIKLVPGYGIPVYYSKWSTYLDLYLDIDKCTNNLIFNIFTVDQANEMIKQMAAMVEVAKWQNENLAIIQKELKNVVKVLKDISKNEENDKDQD